MVSGKYWYLEYLHLKVVTTYAALRIAGETHKSAIRPSILESFSVSSLFELLTFI